MFVNNVTAPYYPQQQPPVNTQNTHYESPVEQLFLSERIHLRRMIDQDPDFIAFRGLPDPLLTLLYGEKQCLAMTPNTRTIHDEDGNLIGGYSSHFSCPDNEYHPKIMRPFHLEGYWIPLSEGQLFTAELPQDMLMRTKNGIDEILFLVHPSSNDLYTPLRNKYSKNCVLIPALALSSFRTLLIAVPSERGGPIYEMVKVSLDVKIADVERRVHLKECACSVGTSALLAQRPRTITYLHEDWSFVPKSDLINPSHEVAVSRGAGMIHRKIPSWLSDSSSREYVVPLFALFGRKNWPLLKALIEQSHQSPTDFITSKLLQPFAELLLDHAVNQRTSLELHGQNLLLRIQSPTEGAVSIDFAYRDLRGANTEFTETEFNALPKGLRNREHFYSESYCKDAAWVLESISRRVCFELTKQLFKADELEVKDHDFATWKRCMYQRGFSGNWTVDGQDPDAHVMEHSMKSFFRYCYFSKIFGRCLLQVMTREGIFLDLCDKNPKYNYRYFNELLGDSLDPTLKINWFEHLMLCILEK